MAGALYIWIMGAVFLFVVGLCVGVGRDDLGGGALEAYAGDGGEGGFFGVAGGVAPEGE